jgi:hypothetical protein
MSLNLIANPVSILEMMVSATNQSTNITWIPFIISIDSTGVQYQSAANIAIATYYHSPSTFVVWGSASSLPNTNAIRVSALNDTSVIYISGIHSTGSDSELMLPYSISQQLFSSSQLNATLSTVYIQTSSNIIAPIPDGTQISWDTVPYFDNVYANLYGGSSIPTTAPIVGYSTSAQKITYTGPSSAYDLKFYTTTQIINDKYALDPILSGLVRNEPQIQITLNPKIRISVETEQSTYTILSATQLDIPVASTTVLSWSANDVINVKGLSGVSLNAPYILGTPGTSLTRIELSAIDLTNSYQYTLSSFTGTVSGTFRPYDTITETSFMTARTVKLPNENNIYKYSLQALGITNGIPHIIAPNQWIRWECGDTTVTNAKYSDDTTPYTFGTQSIAENIDNLYVRIAPTVTRSPKTCSVGFQLCALSGSQVSNGIYGVYNFDISYTEWLDETYYNPKFRFQYEPEIQTTIYRPLATATYAISNTSVLPTNSFGYIIYTFNNSVCSIPYDIRNQNPAPSAIYHPFETSIPCVCSISMTVCASAVGFNSYFVREAPTKHIIFENIPPASGFVVYPEYGWDGSTWQPIVTAYPYSGTIMQPNVPLSAYSLCHTENFFLSSPNGGKTSYQWNIQSNDLSVNGSTITNAPTAWIPLKTAQNSMQLSVCASVFSGLLSSDMSSRYYDTPSGTQFVNFVTTLDRIQLSGSDDLGVRASLSDINHLQHPVPNTLYLSGAYSSLASDLPFNAIVNAFYFDLSSEFWNELQTASSQDNGIATSELNINVDDIGDSFLGVPLNETTKIQITPGLQYTLELPSTALHPVNNDWCLSNITTMEDMRSVVITAYPMDPVIYNPNRFMLTGANVKMENLVQCFSGVTTLTWEDRGNTDVKTTCAPYITTFDEAGNYSVTLTNNYVLGTTPATPLTNEFLNIVNIQNSYLQYDPNISRIFGFTKIKLPYDVNDCAMPPNEWVVKDTFNATITKLHENLTYLENMAQLYDVPPTDYVGWFGTLYYNNSAERTRWFVNTPHNSYSYDHPEKAINYTFDNIQSGFVRDNTMYISNGTSVSILSGDLWGTQLGTRTYKTLGDDFINIRAVKLDSENRIYLLDSYDSINPNAGSKNRVLVFSFSFNTMQWQLMYEWGGLGGPGAKNKFNKPSDLYVDSNNVLWITDTNNKCIKKFTRTGSWLNTITSEHFTDTEMPISITKDLEDNLYVLTNNQIVKLDSDGGFIAVYPISGGALKLESCQDDGFVYIVYADRIVKFTSYGAEAGIIAYNDFSQYTKDYRNAFHDEYRNLYVFNKNHILKYIDELSIVTLKLDTANLMWPLEKLLVQKDEYIQDWVINRCFQRLWDNLEIYRQSLIGKFGYQTFQNITRTTFVSSQQPPADFDYCNYDWLYNYGRFVTQDVIFSYEKPVVRSFTIDEYKWLPYAKALVYIGINELNSADVYNRVISKLHECESTLLQMIND